jgi:hypothetical protein
MASPSSGGTTTWGPCGTGISASSDGTATVGPYGTRTSSSSDGTATMMGCVSETSSSPTRMRFTLETSSSPTCVTPNSSFIVSNVICKNHNIPKWFHSRERSLSIFEKKGKAKNLPIGKSMSLHTFFCCLSMYLKLC